MSRCTGHCCRAFPLSLTPEEIADPTRMARVVDGETLAEMLIPLGKRSDWPDGRPLERGESHFYTCRHHDATSGDCQIYERRPWTCSAYPYDKACDQPGCTMKESNTK